MYRSAASRYLAREREIDALPRHPCRGILSLSLVLSLSRSARRLRTLAQACLPIYRCIPSQSHALR